MCFPLSWLFFVFIFPTTPNKDLPHRQPKLCGTVFNTPLLVIGYLLSVIGYRLLAIGYWLHKLKTQNSKPKTIYRTECGNNC